jgi:hypothetical protein
MRTITLPLRTLGFIIATRAALAAGLGLLFSNRLSPSQRRAAGFALFGFGVVTTVPALWWASHGIRRFGGQRGVGTDPQLIGASRYPRKGDERLLARA